MREQSPPTEPSPLCSVDSRSAAPATRSFRSAARSSTGVQLALGQLGRRIRSLREQRALSQQVAAFRAELDPKHWQVVEQGRTNPTVASLVAISRALDVPISQLF